jgi:hypothetical protein
MPRGPRTDRYALSKRQENDLFSVIKALDGLSPITEFGIHERRVLGRSAGTEIRHLPTGSIFRVTKTQISGSR